MKNFNWRYAFGELVIVTAGILLAFSLNNWAQTRKQKQEEVRYLESLLVDLQADSVHLSALLENLSRRQKLAYSIAPHFQAKLPGRDTIMMTIFGRLSGSYQNFVPHEATYQTLASSGDLKLLRNFDLKNQIVDHYNHYLALDQENERNNHYIKAIVSPYYMENFPFGTPDVEPDRFLSDIRLQNIVYGWFGILQIQTHTCQRTLSQCSELMKAIKTELAGRVR